MRLKRLQTRFLLAGTLLVLATVGSSLWSVWTFARLGRVVDETLRDSRSTIDLITALSGALEREDDALLLAMSGSSDSGRQQVAIERQRVDEKYRQLLRSFQPDEVVQQKLAKSLGEELAAYRKAGSELIANTSGAAPLRLYHERVNPRLRQAVATCAQMREVGFREMESAGVSARDEARKSTWIVTSIALGAIVLASVVALWLARSILRPVGELAASLEALRQGDFGRRITSSTVDEMAELADGFNRMAEALAEYRRSSLGELLTAKTTLEATLNALPDPVFVLAPNEELIAANPPGREILNAKQTIGASRLDDLPLLPEHFDAVRAALSGVRYDSQRIDFGQTLAVELSGQTRRFFVAAVSIPEFAPHCNGAVVVLTDVTDFARLDELRSELVAVASHELKTPLTSLRMNLLLLQERAQDLSTRQQEMLATALAGLDELAATVDELLDLTRIEAGQLRIQRERVDLEQLVDQAVSTFQPRFLDAQVNLQSVHQNGNSTIRGDHARLRVVLNNLLANALKYTPDGGSVVVLTKPVPAPNSRPSSIRVSVSDTGPGVPIEFRQRIFEKFFRVEHQNGNKSEYRGRGTGIGLYLCRQIVDAHGGTITCEASESGHGATITMEFHLED